MEVNSVDAVVISPEARIEAKLVKIRYFLPYGFRVRLSDDP
jgi:hypothetical protein